MKIINLRRGQGKTTRLLYASEFNDMPILCSTLTEKRHLQEQAKRCGLEIPEPITVSDVTSNTLRDNEEILKDILVDEAPMVLQNLLSSLGMRSRVRAITLTEK